MGITTVGDKKDRQYSESSSKAVDTSTGTGSRKNRRRLKKMLPVQRLFETCKEDFATSGTNVVPSPQDVERIRAVLDDIKPMDVGVTLDMPYFRAKSSTRFSRITYLHIYECDKFSMGIFCLPPSSVIPLHNHPGMTVFCKLLLGTLHIKSYDWVDSSSTMSSPSSNPPQVNGQGVGLAKVKVNSQFAAPCSSSVLYPADGGNMHCLTAVTACAVLDVLCPPYSDADGRHCTYFRELPFNRISVNGVTVPEEEKENYAWLQERDKPEDLIVVGAKYGGPMIGGNY